MRCYSVLIVAHLTFPPAEAGEPGRPQGYSVVRYVLARDKGEAHQRAVERERRMLSNDDADVRSGTALVRFEVEEVASAPVSRLLYRPYGRAYFDRD